MSVDEITLTLPRERDFYGVAHHVLGGLGARLDLTFESLADLQLALDGLLAHNGGEGDVTVRLRVHPGAIEAIVGPFDGASLRAELDRDTGEEVGLRRILETVVDRLDVHERDGGHWVELTKNVRLEGAPEG